jgi:signal transduction histidine kinase
VTLVDERPASEIVADLLALIAHDLRNPLSALRSNLGFIGSVVQRVDQDASEAVVDAMVSCDGLAQIIDNVEVMIFALKGQRAPELGAVVLSQAVAAAIEACRSTAKSHGVALELLPGPTVDVAVRSHQDLLSRALGNLIRNSIQHGGESKVMVAVRSDGKTATVRISDGGDPLDPAQTPSPFGAAGQLSAKHSHSGRYGRGLGLWCASVTATAAGASLKNFAGSSRAERNVFELELSVF